MIKVLVINDFSSGYSRRLLKGIIRYSKEVGSWSFIRMPLYYLMAEREAGIIDFAKKWHADAIIAQLRDVNVEALKELNIPIVVQNYHERSEFYSNLTGDYHGTGVMAAEFFLNKGFTNYAYYGYRHSIWSREREAGYRETVERAGYTCHILENENSNLNEWLYNTEQIGEWLQHLPKPVALFACDDAFANQISESCYVYGIRIPDEVAILGVDNDDLQCNLSSPPLSSIVLDVENGGYQAAKLLDQYLHGEITESFNIVVKPLYIEARASTDRYAASDHHIKKILDYISQNYVNRLSVKELVNLVPLSRRVLEKRFKEQTGTSIYQCILDHRINYFIKLLLTTDMHLPDAAMAAGFEDYKNVSRIFRKYKHISPAEYRKEHKKR